uniref:Uncharacterized protein n=1 Tax=Arundo donax TaxID=35708 RepID=A0A0A9S652_ARUDO
MPLRCSRLHGGLGTQRERRGGGSSPGVPRAPRPAARVAAGGGEGRG